MKIENDIQNFQLLTGEINRLLPDYKTAWANIETIGDVYGANIFYLDTQGNFRYWSEGLEPLMVIFNAMRDTLIIAGKPPFSSANLPCMRMVSSRAIMVT